MPEQNPSNQVPFPGRNQPAAQNVQLANKPAQAMMQWRFEFKFKGEEKAISGFATADTLPNAVLKLLATMSDKQQQFDGLMVTIAQTPSGLVIPH